MECKDRQTSKNIATAKVPAPEENCSVYRPESSPIELLFKVSGWVRSTKKIGLFLGENFFGPFFTPPPPGS